MSIAPDTTDTMEQLARVFRLQVATAEKDRSYERYNHASVALTLDQVRERAAQVHTLSHESLRAKIPVEGPLSDREREIALTFVRYCVHGRA